MSNYFVVDAIHNLIVSVIASSAKPRNGNGFLFCLASDKALDTYYKHTSKHSYLPDIGWMMQKHPYLLPK